MEELDIKEFERLIDEACKLPSRKNDGPTFMEICNYPYSRFEEICSRILKFYFNPFGEHKMGKLWLSALFDCIDNHNIDNLGENIYVRTEEPCEGKFLDLLVLSDNYAIGIENKINANLYNDIERYKNHVLTTYNKKNTVMIVLSMKPITDKNAIDKIRDNGFFYVSYRTLFEKVKKHLGDYIHVMNTPYLTMMLDFMKTIENKDCQISKIEYDFFINNEVKINQFINRINDLRTGIRRMQIDKIAQIQKSISDQTKADWWAYQDWDLGIKFKDAEGNERIGIESNFKEGKSGAYENFAIYITTWNLKDWQPYRDIVVDAFNKHYDKDLFLDETANNNSRVYLHLPILVNASDAAIVNELKIAFDIMSDVCKNIR